MNKPIGSPPEVHYRPGMFWLSVVATVWSVFLLYAGGFTTSIEAGMAFLDWPLSNGSVNPDGWLTDRAMRAEHSHRLLGMQMGLWGLALLFANYKWEYRPSVRWLSRVLVLVIILQGVLGGARVRLDQLNIVSDNNLVAQGFAVLHACGAQVVVLLLVSMAVMQSRFWVERQAGLRQSAPRWLQSWGRGAVLLIFLQILIGAIVRHLDVGLAISTFPYSNPEGGWLPLHWNYGIAIHFAHRVGAAVLTVAIIGFIGGIYGNPATRKAWGKIAWVPLLLLGLQWALGAMTIFTKVHEHVATAHLLMGAFLLAITWMLALMTCRLPNTSPGCAEDLSISWRASESAVDNS